MPDNRTMCKYGESCYQKNPEHHKKYKHPKRKSDEELYDSQKKLKGEGNEEKAEKNNITNTGIYPIDFSCSVKMQIEKLFLVTMPEDFFSFYGFCKSLSPKCPCKSLIELGIELVGPFHVFEKEKLKSFTHSDALRHFRYYYDPPEFQTVLKVDSKTDLHYGYIRDEPNQEPSFVGSNEAKTDCIIKCVGDNLFSVLNFHIDNEKKRVDPFKKMKFQKIQNALTAWSKKENITLNIVTEKIRKRRSKVVAKTFHEVGIVVPYNKETEVGYRKLSEEESSLKKILSDIQKAETEDDRNIHWSRLQPVIAAANIANDEFDFGTSLELGINLFCFGDKVFHRTILRILKTSYELLDRPAFITILSAHLENRVKGSNLNTIMT